MPPTLDFEKVARFKGYVQIAGIDEAGRGPWAGPVSAAAVILPRDFAHAVLNDSKQLTEKKREIIFEELMADKQILWGIGLASAEEIDSLNILRATHLAMQRAVADLCSTPDFLLIDGRPVKGFAIPQQAIVKGDAKSLSIAAASILAKVTRDRLMLEIGREFPQYGFAKHKGYGTAQHSKTLQEFGPCPVHRKSFAPVRAALAQRPL
ncbi:MAG: ribonuclease HII [Verrucomicrobiota bacterium]|nr:ribonuclease HII [Verrucomicrobiota bacterium]